MKTCRLNQPINHDGTFIEAGLHAAANIPAWAFEAGLAVHLSTTPTTQKKTGSRQEPVKSRAVGTTAPIPITSEEKENGPDHQ